MEHKIAIIGAGQLGTALALALQKKGVCLSGVASRTSSSALHLSKQLGNVFSTQHPGELLQLANVFFFTTPDDLIEPLCKSLAASSKDLGGKIFFHCSGSLPADILKSVQQKKASIGALHPLQTFSNPSEDVLFLFQNTLIAIDGDAEALNTAKDLITLLGGIPIEITTSQKTLYHTAAILVSNYSIALFEAALSLFEMVGIDRSKGVPALASLLQTTTRNIQKSGPIAALTGPIARGDIHTVSHHIESLRQQAPDLLPVYQQLGILAVSIAHKKGTVDSVSQETLLGLFKSF